MIEFKTSKGEFVVVELNNNSTDWIFTLIPILGKTATHDSGFSFKYSHVFKLSEAKEEDAKFIVDSFELYGDINVGYKNYTEDEPVLDTPLESLQSLLKSKGIDVNNGNWYLFKKLK